MAKDGRAIDHQTLECFRLAAVRLHKNGVTVETISKSLCVTSVAVYKWLKKARTDGLRSLRSSKARGPEPLLTEKQFKDLLKCLRYPACEFGFETDLWTGTKVKLLIHERYKVKYHKKHMPRLLKRIGLKLKFPERRALEQDTKKIRNWKYYRLPKIMENTKKRRGLLFYADESLVSLIPYVGRGWTFPKAKPIVRVSGKKHQHVGITAAVNAQGRMGFELTREKERFTAKVFLRFIRKLRREYPRRHLTIIVDGAKPHKARIVKDFERENKSWLKIEFIPAYSPELNPGEEVWNSLKTQKLNSSMAKDKDELRNDVKKSMKNLKKDAEKISSFFDKITN